MTILIALISIINEEADLRSFFYRLLQGGLTIAED